MRSLRPKEADQTLMDFCLKLLLEISLFVDIQLCYNFLSWSRLAPWRHKLCHFRRRALYKTTISYAARTSNGLNFILNSQLENQISNWPYHIPPSDTFSNETSFMTTPCCIIFYSLFKLQPKYCIPSTIKTKIYSGTQYGFCY